MTAAKQALAICSCEDTMPLDGNAIAAAFPGQKIASYRHLCRSQLENFRSLLAEVGAAPLTVACTQEAPLFQEVAEDLDHAGALSFANIRENAGWSNEARQAGPKMAALLAAAAQPMPPTRFTTLKSEGVALIYGRDETAIRLGERLADHLDVTVILTRPRDVPPPQHGHFPVYQGTVGTVTGHLGAFRVTVNDFAAPDVSSRSRLTFGPTRDGAVSECDVLIDVSGGTALVTGAAVRPGYLRADPGDHAAIEKLIGEASHLTGEFDKPHYIQLRTELCAHSRSKKTGCTRCLDLCPAGAITSAGDHVAVSAEICAGCGACAAACPTGAITYDLPPAHALLTRIRTMLAAYRAAGGTVPVLLIHDRDHGEPLIAALARHGKGLPAHVIPVLVNEVTQAGLETIGFALAAGAGAVRFLLPMKSHHNLDGLRRNVGFGQTMASAFGRDAACVGLIETDDPDQLLGALDFSLPAHFAAPHATDLPMGSGRGLLKQTVEMLAKTAPAAPGPIALGSLAPFGKVEVQVEGCTLCLACVQACPVSALTDNPEKPQLRFQEDLCVQCGLCAATCPEKVITLKPQFDLAAWVAGPQIVKEEEPFHCINCGKAFGTRSTVERIVAKLEHKHWMFAGEQSKRISVIKMCEDCRVEVVVNESFDPHASPQRPAPRTTEDYLRERAKDGQDPLN